MVLIVVYAAECDPNNGSIENCYYNTFIYSHTQKNPEIFIGKEPPFQNLRSRHSFFIVSQQSMEIDVSFEDDSKVTILPNVWHHKMLMLQPKCTASVNVGSDRDEAAGPVKCTDAEYEHIIQQERDKEGTPELCIGDIIKFHQPGMVLDKRCAIVQILGYNLTSTNISRNTEYIEGYKE